MTIDTTEVNNVASAMDNKFEKTGNKVTSLSASSTDAEYPSAKCVFDLIGSAITYINS